MTKRKDLIQLAKSKIYGGLTFTRQLLMNQEGLSRRAAESILHQAFNSKQLKAAFYLDCGWKSNLAHLELFQQAHHLGDKWLRTELLKSVGRTQFDSHWTGYIIYKEFGYDCWVNPAQLKTDQGL